MTSRRHGASIAAAVLNLLAGTAHGQASGTEQRSASAAELASFNYYFQQQLASGQPLPGATPPALLQDPVLTATRTKDQHGRPTPWQLSASVDTRPRHTAPGLCHLYRSRYQYDAAARDGQRWSMLAEPIEFIWLSGGPVPCSTPPQWVALPQTQAQALPAAQLVRLLEQQATLLERARLLFAGNTSCARQRAYQFSLSSITGAAPQAGADAMYLLNFRSDRSTSADITVRRHGAEYTAWNVSCRNN